MHKKKLLKLYKALYRHFGPQHWWPAKTKFEVIVGAILTQNTAWSNVEKAIRNLAREKLINPSSLSKIRKNRIARLIRPSGYYNVKTERLKYFLSFLQKRYGGSIKRMFYRPTDILRHELLRVKGLGKETVDSILLYAGKRPIFVVDAYTKRILSRHKIAPNDSDYDSIQQLFMRNLPNNELLFNEYHALLVKLAKDVCFKKNPRCGSCPVRKII